MFFKRIYAVYYLEQIQEAAPHKNAAVQPLTALSNHLSKMNKKYWALLGKQRRIRMKHSLTESFTWTRKFCPTSKILYQLCTNSQPRRPARRKE